MNVKLRAKKCFLQKQSSLNDYQSQKKSKYINFYILDHLSLKRYAGAMIFKNLDFLFE